MSDFRTDDWRVGSKLLRPYQIEGVQDIRDCNRRGASSVCYQLPTSAGKSLLFAYIVRRAVRLDSRALITAHREEIVDQIAELLTEAGIDFRFRHFWDGVKGVK